MLRFAAPVFTLQPPVLQNNRKVPAPSCNCLGSLTNPRWSIDLSHLKACYLLNFAKNSLFSGKIQARPVRIRLRTPPSSLRKPHVSDTTPNRAFLRGFPATHFLDFGLCRRSRILVAILALCLCIQKFRSRQPGFEHEVGSHRTRNSDFWATIIRDLEPALADG